MYQQCELLRQSLSRLACSMSSPAFIASFSRRLQRKAVYCSISAPCKCCSGLDGCSEHSSMNSGAQHQHLAGQSSSPIVHGACSVRQQLLTWSWAASHDEQELLHWMGCRGHCTLQSTSTHPAAGPRAAEKARHLARATTPAPCLRQGAVASWARSTPSPSLQDTQCDRIAVVRPYSDVQHCAQCKGLQPCWHAPQAPRSMHTSSG